VEEEKELHQQLKQASDDAARLQDELRQAEDRETQLQQQLDKMKRTHELETKYRDSKISLTGIQVYRRIQSVGLHVRFVTFVSQVKETN